MSAPAASSVPAPRVFVATPGGWTVMPGHGAPDGAWAVSLRADGPRLVRVQCGQEHEITNPQGRDAMEALAFVLAALINAPVLAATVSRTRAGRPARKARRLLIFSPARWRWESAERTAAQAGDVFRLVESNGKPVEFKGEQGPAMFRWTGATGEEVPCELDQLGPTLIDDQVIRQGCAWLGVSIDHRDAAPATETAAPPPAERQRRRVLGSPPPARRSIDVVPEADEDDDSFQPSVPIPDLPPEPPAIDDDPTQEFPNMPANRVQQPPPVEPTDDLPAAPALREVSAEKLAEARSLHDSGRLIDACNLWMDARGFAPGMGHEAEADLRAALGRRKPSAPARRGGGVGVPNLQLVSPPPLIQSDPIDEEERGYLLRVAAEHGAAFDEELAGEPAVEPAALDDYEAAQAAARDADPVDEIAAELDDDADSAEQIRTIPVSFSSGTTRATFTRNDGTEAGIDDGRDAYVYQEPPVELGRPVARGDVIPQFGVCVSVVERNVTVVLTDEEREFYVVRLTEMPGQFAALEQKKRDFMAAWKKEKDALQKEELRLGTAVREFKEVRTIQVAGLIKDGWVTEIDADRPDHIIGTRRPNENDHLQEDLFARRPADEPEDDDRDDEDDEE